MAGSDLNRGEIWLYDFGRPDERRPVLVLTRQEVIPLLHAVVVAPITSTIRGAPSEVVVGTDEGVKPHSAGNLDHLQPGYLTEQHADLAHTLASQAAVAVVNARLYAQAQRVAAMEERQRLARELHDSVSQAVYGIGLGARTALALFERSPEEAGKPLHYILSLAEAALSEMRALIFELRPDSLEKEGLVAALERQVEVLRNRHGLEVVAELCGEPVAPLGVKEALYRIAQEATHNTVKHARAARVTIRLRPALDGLHEMVGEGLARQVQHLVVPLLAQLVADRRRQEQVNIQRQVRPVLLGGAGRQEDHLLHLDGIVHLGPGQLVVLVGVAGLHGILLAAQR